MEKKALITLIIIPPRSPLTSTPPKVLLAMMWALENYVKEPESAEDLGALIQQGLEYYREEDKDIVFTRSYVASRPIDAVGDLLDISTALEPEGPEELGGSMQQGLQYYGGKMKR